MNINVTQRRVVALGIRLQIRHEIIRLFLVKRFFVKILHKCKLLRRVICRTVYNPRVITHSLPTGLKHQNPIIFHTVFD